MGWNEPQVIKIVSKTYLYLFSFAINFCLSEQQSMTWFSWYLAISFNLIISKHNNAIYICQSNL
jgi:hypothetical protein